MKKEMRDIVPKSQLKSIRNIPIPEKQLKEEKNHKEEIKIKEKEVNIEIPIRLIDEPTKEEKKTSRRNKAIWVVAVLLIFSLFFVISSVFGKATITINPKVVSFDVPQNISAKKNPGNNEVGYSQLTLSVTDSTFVKGSDQKQVSTKAAGKIVIYNNTVSAQKLVSGTRLSTPDGLIFTLDKTLTVPARSIKAGTTTPGSIAGDITASDTGEKYNVGLVDLNIIAFQGSPKFDQIFARSKTSIGGGEQGVIAIVDKSLMDTSTQNLDQKIVQELISKVSKQLPEKYIIPDQAYTITFGTSSPVLNQDGATVKVTGTINAFALDAKSILDNVASNGGQKDTLGTNDVKILNSNLKSVSFSQINDSLTIKLNGNLTLEAVISPSQVLKSVSGLNRRSALATLDSLPGVDSADVTFSPIWKLTVPDNESKVEINIK